MRRRELVTLVAGMAIARPGLAVAQTHQNRLPPHHMSHARCRVAL